jgi:3',5'-cyclic AMP phosphodiesterase CpdA
MTRTNSKNLVLTYAALAAILLAGCNGPKWSFIVTGDSRDGENGVNTLILSELAAQIVKAKPDFVLISGDLVSGYNDQAALQSQLQTWRNTMKPVYDAGIGVYPVRGNHDVGRPPGVQAWNNVFTGKFALPDNGPDDEKNLTYSFTHKNALIVGLDQYVELRRVDQDWLDSQLAANTKPHLFFFGHEPAFKARHDACLDDYPADRDMFWASIEKAGARTYFCGHDHFYDHARVDDDGDPENDIHQYIVGTAGAPLRDSDGNYDGVNNTYTVENIYYAEEFGYCLVEIDDRDVTITWFERTAPAQYQPKEAWSYTAATPSQLPGRYKRQ